MKCKGKLKRFATAAMVSALLLCSSSGTYASYNDERFEIYINMNNKVTNEYVIPNLYRQDSAYAYYKNFPVVVSGGVEYVPISAFSLFSYITVTYSKTSDNFYITNEKTKSFLSVDVVQNIAETHDGTIIDLPTKIFYQTRYIPARKVASVLGTVFCESYDSFETGVYAFRIRDNAASLSFSSLLDRYVPKRHVDEQPPEDQNPTTHPPQSDPPSGNDPSGETTPDTPPPPPDTPPEKPKDPYEDVSKRNMHFLFTEFNPQTLPDINSTLEKYGQTASFCLTYDDIYNNPMLVRDLYINSQPIVLTAPQSVASTEPNQVPNTTLIQQTQPLSAQQFALELDRANSALYAAVKHKTRLCYVPDCLIQGLYESQDPQQLKADYKKQLEELGYIAILSNCTLPKSYENPYTVYNSAITSILNDFDKTSEQNCYFEIKLTSRSDYACALIFEFMRKYPQFITSQVDITTV